MRLRGGLPPQIGFSASPSSTCTFLDRALVLEAVYECCVGKEDQVEIYNRFCDRLEQKHAPYLIVMDNSAFKLELPLLGE